MWSSEVIVGDNGALPQFLPQLFAHTTVKEEESLSLVIGCQNQLYSDHCSKGERLQYRLNCSPTETKLTEAFKGRTVREQKRTTGK